jgi:hypothetical protein
MGHDDAAPFLRATAHGKVLPWLSGTPSGTRTTATN